MKMRRYLLPTLLQLFFVIGCATTAPNIPSDKVAGKHLVTIRSGSVRAIVDPPVSGASPAQGFSVLYPELPVRSPNSLPQLTVSEKTLSRFTVLETMMADGTYTVQLMSAKKEYHTLWVENARVGDYIVAIDGKPIEAFGRGRWSHAFSGKTRLTLARRVGSKAELLVVDSFDVGLDDK